MSLLQNNCLVEIRFTRFSCELLVKIVLKMFGNLNLQISFVFF